MRPSDQREQSPAVRPSSRWDLHLVAVVVLAVVLLAVAAVSFAAPDSDTGELATVLLVCTALILALVA